MKNSFHIILLFMLLFSFRIPIVYNSTILAGLISFLYILVSPISFNNLINILKSKYFFNILSFTFFLFCCSVFIPLLHSTYDFTILKLFRGVVPTLICTALVLSVILRKTQEKNYILKMLFTVFFIQTIIEVIAFISPSFREIVIFFQVKEVAEKAANYGGIRGLSLSSGLFFGLALSFGLIYIFYVKYLLGLKKIKTYHIIYFFILIVGGLFTGRTIFIGLGFAFLLFIFSSSQGSKIIIFIKSISTIFIFIVIMFLVVPTKITNRIVNKLLPFALEMFYKYSETGSIETSSTNRLFEMLNTNVSTQTFFIGDGKYTNEDESYYMHTDSGYFRHILFGGFFYMIFFFFYQLRFFVSSKKITFDSLKAKRRYKLFLKILILYILTLHIKGEAMGFAKYLLVILMIYSLSLNYKQQNKTKHNKINYVKDEKLLNTK